MQAVQPSVPARAIKNCPFALRQHSSMLAASNSPSAVPQFNSPALEGVVKHLICALPVNVQTCICLMIPAKYPVQHARPMGLTWVG